MEKEGAACREFQEEVVMVSERVTEQQLEFSGDKWKWMHTGKTNPDSKWTVTGSENPHSGRRAGVMRDISEEMSAQLFARIRKIGKLNSGDRQGMKRKRPGKTQRFSCQQEIGSIPCPHPNFQRHRAEDLLRGARREGKQTLLGAELLKRGQRESPRQGQPEPRNSHLSRLVLLSKASLSTDHCGYCCSRD